MELGALYRVTHVKSCPELEGWWILVRYAGTGKALVQGLLTAREHWTSRKCVVHLFYKMAEDVWFVGGEQYGGYLSGQMGKAKPDFMVRPKDMGEFKFESVLREDLPLYLSSQIIHPEFEEVLKS